MKNAILLSAAVCLFISSFALADTFGTGANQFTIDFVTISGDASSANGTEIGNVFSPKPFTDPGNFRMGVYEITNNQWNKFVNINGIPTGNPSNAYDNSAYWTGTNVPTTYVSWYEAAQFVNWLNTSTSHQVAYKFTDGNLRVWNSGDEGYDASNPYRNSNAIYFLPTENEWIKAGYWNGTSIQTYATKPGESLYQGSGSNGGWNYYDGDNGPDGSYDGVWDVGSGSEELNGTYDIMGNVMEWMESPYDYGNYQSSSIRHVLSGSYGSSPAGNLQPTCRIAGTPSEEYKIVGFRVASVPEPATVSLLAFGGLSLLRKRK